MSLHDDMVAMGDRALCAARALNLLSARKKNNILKAMADELEQRKPAILEANAKDVDEATNAGLSEALVDRLVLNDVRVNSMVKGMRAIADLKDPTGTTISRWIRPNGLEIVKVHVPIGVIGIIYESRPNVTADTSALCIKSSNAVILRGGKEAVNSNKAIVKALIEGGEKKGLPDNAIQFVETPDHEAVRELVRLEGKVDLIIPRGGETLIRAVTAESLVPVLKHYKGVCHIYVDESADLEMAVKISENAKCQRPGVCNAMETLLVNENIANEFLPKLAERFGELGVELRGDDASRAIVPDMKAAVEEDWSTEYLDLILSVRIVPNVKAAIEHINQYGTKHSDAIVASDEAAQKQFTQEVDASTVYINASTRFTDGGEFGMGAEIGISTDKLHARGPVGLKELTTYKYIVYGKGQVRGS